MQKKLFGTDGIRGEAGKFPLDGPTATALGGALGDWARHHSPDPEVLIGVDTRESGYWLAQAVAAGLVQSGVRVRYAGVVSTPAVAYLTKEGPFVAGAMISASHNPYHDNGIKVFAHSGYKLPDAAEAQLENEIVLRLQRSTADGIAPDLAADPALVELYLDRLASASSGLAGLKLVVDCANGSASVLAPRLFERLGAQVHAVFCQPDGRNINDGCGALHPEQLRDQVLASGADLGIAFDGDADRAIFVARNGKLLDGDWVLLLCARHLAAQAKLPAGNQCVVATVMSNLGLERALAAEGIRLARTAVGDKYVLEEMLRLGAPLGGEQSGHVIYLDYATTGDGMVTALRVIEAVRWSGKRPDELADELPVYPQKLVNVRVSRRLPLESLPGVQHAIREAEAAFGDSGRLLVRYSGTEPLARVMVEGPDLPMVEHYAHAIAETILAELGAEQV